MKGKIDNRVKAKRILKPPRSSRRRKSKMETPLVNVADSAGKLLFEDGARHVDSSNAAADAFDAQAEEFLAWPDIDVEEGGLQLGPCEDSEISVNETLQLGSCEDSDIRFNETLQLERGGVHANLNLGNGQIIHSGCDDAGKKVGTDRGGTTDAGSQGFRVVGVMQVDPLEERTSCLFVDCDSVSLFTDHDNNIDCMGEAHADQSDEDVYSDGEQGHFNNREEWVAGSDHNEEKEIDEETLTVWSREARKKSDDKEMEHMQNDHLSESLGRSKVVQESQIVNTSLNMLSNLSIQPLMAGILGKDCSVRGHYEKVGCGIFNYACHTLESVQAAVWTQSSVKWFPSNDINKVDLPLKECRVMMKDIKNSRKANVELHGPHGECVPYKKTERVTKSNPVRNLKIEAFLPEVKKCIVLVEDIGRQSINLFQKGFNENCYPLMENLKLSRQAAVKLHSPHSASVTHAETDGSKRSKLGSKYKNKLGLPELKRCFVEVEDVQRQSYSSSFFHKKLRKEYCQFPRNKTPTLPNLNYFKGLHLKECSVLVEHVKPSQVSSRKKTGYKTTTLFDEGGLQKKCFVLLKDILGTKSLRKRRAGKQSHKLYADKLGLNFRGGAAKVLITKLQLRGLLVKEGTKAGQARMPKLVPRVLIPRLTKMAGVTDSMKSTGLRECSVVLEKAVITNLRLQSLLVKKGTKADQARMPKLGHPISIPYNTKTKTIRDSLKNINLRECSVVLDRMHKID